MFTITLVALLAVVSAAALLHRSRLLKMCTGVAHALSYATSHPLFWPVACSAVMVLLAIAVHPVIAFGAPFPFVFGTSLTEGPHTADFLISEAPGQQSRDTVTVTVPAATKLLPGTVLGQVAASGKYVPYDDGSSDGREESAGVLYGELDNSGGVAGADMTGVVINWSAEVREADLVWVNDADDVAGISGLRTLGIKAR